MIICLIILQFSDPLEQGNWLGVLAKETEDKSGESRSPDHDVTNDNQKDPKQDNGEVNVPAKRVSQSFLHSNVQGNHGNIGFVWSKIKQTAMLVYL